MISGSEIDIYRQRKPAKLDITESRQSMMTFYPNEFYLNVFLPAYILIVRYCAHVLVKSESQNVLTEVLTRALLHMFKDVVLFTFAIVCNQ